MELLDSPEKKAISVEDVYIAYRAPKALKEIEARQEYMAHPVHAVRLESVVILE